MNFLSASRLVTSNTPPGRDDTAMADAPELGGTFLYGGQGGGYPQRDFWVLAEPPAIALSESSVSRSIAQGESPSAHTINVWNAGGGVMDYSITDDATWLSVSPSSGTAFTEIDDITVNYSASSLASGNYSATVEISSPGSMNSPQSIQIDLSVSPSDQDGDGLLDDTETALGTDPLDADSDDDGLDDGDEVNVLATNPLDPDSDDDELSDGDEVATYATDPLDIDSDDDGYSDGEEVVAGSNPNDGGSIPTPTPVPTLGNAAVIALMIAIFGSFALIVTRKTANG